MSLVLLLLLLLVLLLLYGCMLLLQPCLAAVLIGTQAARLRVVQLAICDYRYCCCSKHVC
jgi:hypothetical protein